MSSTFLERELFQRIGYSTVSFLIDKDGRDISTRRICRNDAEAKKNATSVGVRIKREKRKQEEAGKGKMVDFIFSAAFARTTLRYVRRRAIECSPLVENHWQVKESKKERRKKRREPITILDG